MDLAEASVSAESHFKVFRSFTTLSYIINVGFQISAWGLANFLLYYMKMHLFSGFS